MPTPLDITAVTAAAGSKVVAAVYLPSGLTTAAGTTVTGGTVTGSPTVPTGSAAVYVGLSESPAQAYSALGVLAGGTALPEGGPYRAEVRKVDAATDMTSYGGASGIAAAFAAATAAGSLVAGRQNYEDNGGAWLFGSQWAGPMDGDIAPTRTALAQLADDFAAFRGDFNNFDTAWFSTVVEVSPGVYQYTTMALALAPAAPVYQSFGASYASSDAA